MKKHKISELVEDFDVYPRGSVDSQHATDIASAMESGVSVPPIIIEKKTKRIVDGVHRKRAFGAVFGEDHEVDCIEKSYANDGELVVDAMRYNSAHGRSLTSHDKAKCLLLADKFNIDIELVGQALHMTQTRLGELRAGRIGRVQSAGPIALKRTIGHMSGRELTEAQAQANSRLSGMNQSFYANQLITLIENDLIDHANPALRDTLYKLENALKRYLGKEAA